MSTLELAGGALGVSFAIAQVSASDAGVLSDVAKGGAVAIVGVLFYIFMRQHRDTVVGLAAEHKEAVTRIEAAHEASAKRFDETVDRLVASVDRMVANCARNQLRG